MSEPNVSGDAVPDNPTYAEFFEEELKSETDRKAKYDSRGGNLVTTSGAVHAILVGLGSIGQGSTRSAIPNWIVSLLALALIAFIAAAVTGVVAQLNHGYKATSTAGLRSMLDERWRDSSGESMHRVGADHFRAIESLRSSNHKKEIALRWGYGFQMAAIVLLGPVAIVIVAIK
ncbi:hypothetical protein ACFQFC_21055 [Amorphoplanes digitatis]|uniref:Uncharacterized protein n=1 Tax=Actinoplanes digitatis TaxID=1868 RepID=A0A7W7I594_9ACTN|nr:hypothetical protein [Actinoplanes digitatis]MBB4766708.1 hypothetical protein [Actinoplanes digitatis]BFE76857.1 hypothetical protein GCM10020092_101580 [Actinoplanes digitatis]GID96687.1 hypothetical protein Adi01nite_60990 [Actinoplanes digitatis]